MSPAPTPRSPQRPTSGSATTRAPPRRPAKPRPNLPKLGKLNTPRSGATWRPTVHFDRGRPQDLAAARKALEDATANGPRTTWFRRLARTVCDLEDYEQTADNTDRFLLAWEEWRREAGARLDRVLSEGRALLTDSHGQQCEGLARLARARGRQRRTPTQD